jgi:hypothetical protein
VRRSQGLGNVRSSAEAGESEAACLQVFERIFIRVPAFRLDQNGVVPFDPEPAKILENPTDELRSAPRLVEILDPQSELSSPAARSRMADCGTQCVTEVEPTGRGGCETGNDHW